MSEKIKLADFLIFFGKRVASANNSFIWFNKCYALAVLVTLLGFIGPTGGGFIRSF